MKNLFSAAIAGLLLSAAAHAQTATPLLLAANTARPAPARAARPTAPRQPAADATPLATPAKIGHLSGQALLAELPETKVAEAELTAFTKTWQTQYDDLNQRYTKLVKDYQLNGKTLPDTAKANRSARAEALQQQLLGVQQQAQAAIDKKRQALYQPIHQKAQQAIEAVALAKGYDYVLDDQTGQVLYIRKTTNDLLPATKAKLGLN